MIGVYNKKQRMSIISKTKNSVLDPNHVVATGQLPKSGGELYLKVSPEKIGEIDNFLEKLYTILPKQYHVSKHSQISFPNSKQTSFITNDEHGNELVGYGDDLINQQTVNAVHHNMANKIQKYLNENKKNPYALNIGPYHDNVIERGGTHEDYANELLPHIMLKMPQKMYNFLISHKGPVENVKKDFIDHLSKNPEHSDQLDLDYMNILSPE
jgi:hypothetical protein